MNNSPTNSYPIDNDSEREEAESAKRKKAFVLEKYPSKVVGKGRHVRALSLASKDFDLKESSKDRYLILGFDTEYQSNQTLYTIQELREDPSLAERDILSYQYSVLSDDHSFYNGIVYPPGSSSFLKSDRLSIEEFLYIALADGVKNYGFKGIPKRIYLVGHFNRADLPTFRNIDEISKKLDSLRGTFMSVKGGINNSLYIGFEFDSSEHPVVVDLGIRDTLTLTPNLRTKLADIGDLVGVEKVKLHEDPKEEKRLKSNMRSFMLDNPSRFEAYALRDSDICVHYLKTMIDLYQQNTQKKKVPFTLSQIGVDILLEHWKGETPRKGKSYKQDVLGMETIQDQYFHRLSGTTKFFNREEFIDRIYFHQMLVTECYHGGRNEQFQFGVSQEDDWFDYDLTSAYPISMSLLGLPDWDSLRFSTDNSIIEKLTSPHQLVYAQVEFNFPKDVRFPCLPVRSKSGPVFPLSGTAFASAPELFLAKQLQCKLKVIQGLSLEIDESHHPFYGFIKYTVTKRKEERDTHGKGSMNEIFWKEVTNSVYGKVAQGLGFKRRYDLRQRGGKDLEPSKVTQPYYAAHITSYIRATLSEIMNRTPVSKEVFSVTTDGFITNINEDQIKRCSAGRLMKDFSKMVNDIRGEEGLEIKHRVRQLIGWKTRGQATLKPHLGSPIVLAKGGIQAPPELDTAEQDNDWITELFLTRKPDYMLSNQRGIGIRDMIESGENEFSLDFTFLKTNKILNMEFDWKRCPTSPFYADGFKQVSFKTKPWDNVVQLEKLRSVHSSKSSTTDKSHIFNIKTREDLEDLVSTFNVKEAKQEGDKRVYTFHQSDDMRRLKKDLAIAYKHELCGFVKRPPIEVNREGMFKVLTESRGFDAKDANKRIERLTDERLAKYLTQVLGITVHVKDFDNAKRSRFTPHRSRPSPKVLEKLEFVKGTFPALEIDQFVVQVEGLNRQELISL